jgi:hypothetical protein
MCVTCNDCKEGPALLLELCIGVDLAQSFGIDATLLSRHRRSLILRREVFRAIGMDSHSNLCCLTTSQHGETTSWSNTLEKVNIWRCVALGLSTLQPRHVISGTTRTLVCAL